jgi:hypothetical protein
VLRIHLTRAVGTLGAGAAAIPAPVVNKDESPLVASLPQLSLAAPRAKYDVEVREGAIQVEPLSCSCGALHTAAPSSSCLGL